MLPDQYFLSQILHSQKLTLELVDLFVLLLKKLLLTQAMCLLKKLLVQKTNLLLKIHLLIHKDINVQYIL